jgi:hypothetical protein
MRKILFGLIGTALIGALTGYPVMAQESQERGVAPQPGGVKSLEERMERLEEAFDQMGGADKWYERFQVDGLIEVEAGFGRTAFDDPAQDDEKSGDVDLATVELAIGAKISDHADAFVLFKYEEEELFLDEGFITLTGTERFPAYLTAGRQYIPFGNFESHFITDPTTLLLGETNEGALVLGYRPFGDIVDISVGVFNGKVDEAGSDDLVFNYTGRIAVAPREGLTFGASYTSNLAAADAFADQVQSDLKGYVAGWSLFATATLFERLTLSAEYLAALEAFEASEIYDEGDTIKRRPTAWNLELGYAFSDRWQAALRYGGSLDGDAGSGEFLPKTQYGAVVNWGLFENTNVALEYLHSDFENDHQTSDAVTLQLAVEF